MSLFCFAHRGGRGHGTENALATIEKSLALGIPGIEIDVWLHGGKLLVTHDRVLGRVIKASGRLLDVPAEQISELTHYDGSKVAELHEVLALVGNKAILNIEIKGPHSAPAIASLLRNYCVNQNISPDQYVISSFDHSQLQWLLDNAPEFPRAVLVATIPYNLAQAGTELKAVAFNVSIDFISQSLVDDAKSRGLTVNVYTVNDQIDFEELHTMGVDGVFSDFPERVITFNLSLSQ